MGCVVGTHTNASPLHDEHDDDEMVVVMAVPLRKHATLADVKTTCGRVQLTERALSFPFCTLYGYDGELHHHTDHHDEPHDHHDHHDVPEARAEHVVHAEHAEEAAAVAPCDHAVVGGDDAVAAPNHDVDWAVLYSHVPEKALGALMVLAVDNANAAPNPHNTGAVGNDNDDNEDGDGNDGEEHARLVLGAIAALDGATTGLGVRTTTRHLKKNFPHLKATARDVRVALRALQQANDANQAT